MNTPLQSPSLFTGADVERTLVDLGITHVVWLPDSGIGPWETDLENSQSLRLIRVCREGEAWGIAAGLYMAGKRPLVLIQNTGMFESGDSLRHFLFDMELPLYAIIGYRSYLIPDSPDTAKHFTEPVLCAWGIDYIILSQKDGMKQLTEHYRRCQQATRAGAALVPEGRV
jgi:sulfopyruvate decarboxylase subunit alpha